MPITGLKMRGCVASEEGLTGLCAKGIGISFPGSFEVTSTLFHCGHEKKVVSLFPKQEYIGMGGERKPVQKADPGLTLRGSRVSGKTPWGASSTKASSSMAVRMLN
jgi:hypothetical protein